jgi:hypothetical protein
MPRYKRPVPGRALLRRARGSLRFQRTSVRRALRRKATQVQKGIPSRGPGRLSYARATRARSPPLLRARDAESFTFWGSF